MVGLAAPRACQWAAGPWRVLATHRRSFRLRAEARVTSTGARGPIRLMAGRRIQAAAWLLSG